MKLLPAPWHLALQMLPLAQQHFPETLTAYAELKECEELQRTFPEVERILLTPEGKMDPFLSFAILVPAHRNQLFFECLNPECSEFAEALVSCPLIRWEEAVITGPSPLRLFPVLDHILRAPCMQRYEVDDEITSFYLPREDALAIQYTIPIGTYLDSLREEHAPAINDVYPYGQTQQTLHELKDTIRFRNGIGLFLNNTKELAAWVAAYEYGGPGALQVAENHRRKGYGEVVLRAMTYQLAQSGYSPKAYVAIGNIPSERLFAKLGYIRDGFEKWCYIIRKNN